MFEQLTKFFHGNGKAEVDSEVALLKQKFSRVKTHDSGSHNVMGESDIEHSSTSTAEALQYWNETSEEGRTLHAPEPHVMQSLRHSATVLQPGATESFQLLRQHPLDELDARRARKSDAFSAARFLRSSKLKRTSA